MMSAMLAAMQMMHMSCRSFANTALAHLRHQHEHLPLMSRTPSRVSSANKVSVALHTVTSSVLSCCRALDQGRLQMFCGQLQISGIGRMS